MGLPVGIEQRGWNYVIHDHDCDCGHLMTKVRCKDLPDSDRVTSDVGMPSTHLVHTNNGYYEADAIFKYFKS